MPRARDIDYDSIAESYASNREASPRVVAHLAEDPGAAARGGRVLEIGCGTANHLAALAPVLGARGVGLDLSSGMLAQARRRNPAAELVRGDAAEGWPFREAAFALAFSVDVIHYVPDLHRFFAEAWRVLRPGGTIVTVTDSHDDIRRRGISRYFPETVPVELRRYPGIDAIRSAMRAAGLDAGTVSHTEHAFPLTEAALARHRNKAYSSLRLLPEASFQDGLRRLEEDVRAGRARGVEVYSYVWGRKA